MQTVDIPLSYLDSHSPGNASSINISYALDITKQDTVSSELIRSAAERVAVKWRYFAGRLVWNATRDRFVIRAPIGELESDYALVELTTEAHNCPCPLIFPEQTTDTCTDAPWFPREYTVSPTRACGFAELGATQAPLVAVHITFFADRQFIGFTIPHGVIDISGFKLWLDAFNCQLNGGEWTAPPLELENLQDAAVARIASESKGDPRGDPLNANGPNGLVYGAKECTALNQLKIKAYATLEERYHGSETSGVFLGSEVVEYLVRRVKAEVKDLTEGREFVSSGDIMSAWLLKSAYADEPDHAQVGITNVLCSRKALGLDHSPRVNWTTTPQLIPDFPSPHSSSLAQMALFNRRRLNAVRSPEHISAWHRFFALFRHSPPPIIFAIGPDGWLISNQAKCGASQVVDWGMGKGVGYEYRVKGVSSAGAPTRSMNLNEVERGVVWMGTMRKSRWASVRREAAELEEELGQAKAKAVAA